jgi:microcystin-dependent protein
MSLTTGRLLLPYPESTDSADVPRDIKALADRVEALTAWIRQADFAANAGVHWPGDLKLSAVAAVAVVAGAPWLPCDGTSYLRADYQNLFDALGGAASPWGLPDGTHFNVPNFKGRVPMGVGLAIANGATAHALGQLIGEETHKLLPNELAIHTHTYDKVTVNGSGSGQSGSNLFVMTGSSTNPTASVQNTTTETPHNTLQPSAVVTVLIKT